MECGTMTIVKCNPTEVAIHSSSFVGLHKLYLSEPGSFVSSL